MTGLSAEAQYPWLKTYPADVKWDSGIPVKTLPEVLDEAVRQHPERVCLSFLGRIFTYKEVGDLADRFATGLQKRGVSKGDKVGLCLPNCPFYVIAYYGVLKAGAAVVNFNPLYAEQEIEHQINDSGATVMVTLNVRQVYPKVERALGRTTLKKIVWCDLADALPPVKGFAFRALNFVKGFMGKADAVPVRDDAAHVSFRHLLAPADRSAFPKIAPSDLAVLQYTGGTTGIPKGAALSHANLTANIYQSQVWFNAGRKGGEGAERMLAVLPFFHVFSMTVQMNLTIALCGVLIMLPRFDVPSLLRTMAKEKPTIFAGVPTLYRAVIDHPSTRKEMLSSLRICVSGGAALPEQIMAGWKNLTGLELIEGYGLSETSPLALANPLHGRKKINSVGIPVPGTFVKIAALEGGAPCALNVPGEICLKGPQVMQGYWNRPDETEKVLDKDNWLHTGDVGYMDGEGYVFIVDRIKDMINASGMKVFPRKVEEAILQHAGVAETIVAGIADDYRGETVKAWIVPKPGQTLSIQDVKSFLKDKLAPYEMPKAIVFRDKLPKTLIGKPDRKALLAEEKSGEKSA